MGNLHNRENLKNLLDEDFWHYYRLNKTVKPKKYKRKEATIKGVKDIFKTMQEMLSESKHGAYLKGIGVIVPKDTEVEVNKGIFKKESKVFNRYRFFFEDEYLSQFFRVTIKYSVYRQEEYIRTPRPYAVMLHRKKIRKN